jgi:rfaE bifunctional protein kinase chain/domain
MISRNTLLNAIPRMAGQHVLVVGDLFLDEYLIGQAARLSREAPIPVLEFEEQRQLPGGGANPAVNIVALGGRVTQVGVVGDDEAGRTLSSLLDAAGIGTEGLVLDPSRPTTTKTRVMARGSLRFPQQLARIDRVDRQPLSPEVEAKVVACIEELAHRAGAVLVSDYRSGLVTAPVVMAVRQAQAQGRLACVDSQGRLDHFAGFDLAKCNHYEAQGYIGQAIGGSFTLETEQDFEEATARLRQELDLGALLITRGPDGLSLRSAAGYAHLPAANRSEVFDVTGAGDTVIAVAALALTAGQAPLVAATLANYAAGLVVRKLGVAAPSPDELAWAIEQWQEGDRPKALHQAPPNAPS